MRHRYFITLVKRKYRTVSQNWRNIRMEFVLLFRNLCFELTRKLYVSLFIPDVNSSSKF